jgi:hypothetical protein
MSTLVVGGDLAAALSTLNRSSHMSVLVGAGASAAAGLPLWNAMVARLLISSGAVDALASATALLEHQDPLLAAEAALAGLAPAARSRLLYEALYGTLDPHVAIARFTASALHRTLIDLFEARAGAVELLTLNVDDLLEEALGSRPGRRFHTRAAAVPREVGGAATVHHLHGVLPRPAPAGGTGLVFTLSDYTALAADPDAWQRLELNLCIQKGPLLLLSTSYNDLDIRQWLHAAPRHNPLYVVVARQGLNLDRGQYARVGPALRAQWRQIGVTALLVDDFADTAQVLRELPHVDDAGYASPHSRARGIWQGHVRDFHTLQAQDAAQLQMDLTRLMAVTGPEASLTLWLADGANSLVRWSSPDRMYLEAAQLRRVDVAYDSPWLAARAYCSDAPLVDPRVREGSDARTETRRWHSVAGVAIRAAAAGSAACPVAVLTSASALDLTADLDQWARELTAVADEWSARLPARA